MKNIVLELYKKKQTVFTFKELYLMFPDLKKQSLKDKLRYAVKTKKLLRLRKGAYAKTNFNYFELANKIYTPSYISLETVLKKEGIIFQEISQITLVSYITRKIKINDVILNYRKIKDQVLTNKQGIIEIDNYFIASKERAFLDALFLFKDYHFDNLMPLDFKKIFQMVKIYKNKALESRVKKYYKIYQKDYA
ncbi:MAG: hypothetical protein QHH09_01885 [Microgenomates group bacterium]|nr:hypothetical protein [Microgenomates group bacterium]